MSGGGTSYIVRETPKLCSCLMCSRRKRRILYGETTKQEVMADWSAKEQYREIESMPFQYYRIKVDHAYQNRYVSHIASVDGVELQTAEHADDVIQYNDLSSKQKHGSCTAKQFLSWLRGKKSDS